MAWFKLRKHNDTVSSPHVVTLGRECTTTLIEIYRFVLYLSQFVKGIPSNSLRSNIKPSGNIKESSPRLIEHRGTDYIRPCRKFYSRSLPVAWCRPGMLPSSLRPTEVQFTSKKVHSNFLMGGVIFSYGCSGRTGACNWWRYGMRKQKDTNYNWNLSIAGALNSGKVVW